MTLSRPFRRDTVPPEDVYRVSRAVFNGFALQGCRASVGRQLFTCCDSPVPEADLLSVTMPVATLLGHFSPDVLFFAALAQPYDDIQLSTGLGGG